MNTDPFAILAEKRTCVVVFDVKCKSCGSIVSDVIFLDSVKSECCDNPLFDDDVKQYGIVIQEMDRIAYEAYQTDTMRRVQFNGRHPDLSTYDNQGQGALLVAMTVIDKETGNLKWDWRSQDDLDVIGRFNHRRISVLIDAAARVSGISSEAEEDTAKKLLSEAESITG